MVIRAAFVSPISLSGFRLPPPIPIPDAVADRGRILKRESIAHILGGSQKTTFPYPRNRNQGPTYACLKESENDLLPRNPGEHGIIIVKSLPEALVRASLYFYLYPGEERVHCPGESQKEYILDILWDL